MQGVWTIFQLLFHNLAKQSSSQVVCRNEALMQFRKSSWIHFSFRKTTKQNDKRGAAPPKWINQFGSSSKSVPYGNSVKGFKSHKAIPHVLPSGFSVNLWSTFKALPMS